MGEVIRTVVTDPAALKGKKCRLNKGRVSFIKNPRWLHAMHSRKKKLEGAFLSLVGKPNMYVHVRKLKDQNSRAESSAATRASLNNKRCGRPIGVEL